MRKSPAMKSALTVRTGCAIVASTTLLLGLLGTVPAMADTGSSDPLAAVTEATPDTANNAAPVATKSTGEAAIDATVADVRVQVPTDPTDKLSLEAEGGGFSVSLPFSEQAEQAWVEKQGVVSYDNNNGSSTVPIVQNDGSVQINTVIVNDSAPREYEYAFTLDEGEKLRLAPDGSAYIEDESGSPVAFIAAPWAKDANGNAVTTRYEVRGSTLVQIVEHSKSDAYPVVADPWLGIGLINGASWITRDSRGRTLVVTPSWFNRISAGDGNVLREGWNEVIRRQPSANTTQMYWQYKCHFVAAPFKSTWNLDTWVRRSSYTDSLAHACN